LNAESDIKNIMHFRDGGRGVRGNLYAAYAPCLSTPLTRATIVAKQKYWLYCQDAECKYCSRQFWYEESAINDGQFITIRTCSAIPNNTTLVSPISY